MTYFIQKGEKAKSKYKPKCISRWTNFISIRYRYLRPDHGSNIVSTQCVIEVKADAVVVVQHQVIPLLLLLLLVVDAFILAFHMVRCVHSR